MSPRYAWAWAPATAANLGPGFDCLGLALDGLGLLVRLRPSDPPRAWRRQAGAVCWQVRGSMAGEPPPPGPANRVVAAVRRAFEAAGCPHPRGWTVRIASNIPAERGLGSSAAAVVAGLAAANRWLARTGRGLERAELLRLAVELEGHADNAAAALLGGAVLVWAEEGGRWDALRFRPHRDLTAVLAVPETRGRTAAARAVLPGGVPLADAVFNQSRTALLVFALQRGEAALLGEAMRDRLHQPYRERLFPWLPVLLERARAAGAAGACLSGAGPAVLALAPRERAAAVAAGLEAGLAECGVGGSVRVCPLALRGCASGFGPQRARRLGGRRLRRAVGAR